MKRFTVRYERDREGWWVASAAGLKGCHTQGRSIEEARRHIREAIAAYLDLSPSEEAAIGLRDNIKVPADVRRALADLDKARAKETTAKAEARKAAARVVRTLTRDLRLSRRDAAALTGYSFQRIHQLVHDSR
ncbi:MAG: type II toxin-antitoxin system HicB family antitoxin [Myxococcaceae bacterium]